MLRRPPVLLMMYIFGAAFLLTPVWSVSPAGAQTVVNQGAPGKQGAWPVTIVGGGSDGGTTGTVTVVPATCAIKENVISVGTSSTSCPPTQQTGRRSVFLCNGADNPGAGLVKVRTDGVAPTMTLGTPGTVLVKGTCISLPVDATKVPRCISDVSGTIVTTMECY